MDVEQEEEKNLTNSQLTNILFSIINWENNKENIINTKDNNKEKSFYLINKLWFDKFKNLVNYQKVISILDNVNVNSEEEILKSMNDYITNNINASDKNSLNNLYNDEKKIIEDLVMKELLENKNFILEIINEEIKNNLHLNENEFIKLDIKYLDDEIYFINDCSFQNNKLIIKLSKNKNAFYEFVFFVENNIFESFIKIIETQKQNFLGYCGVDKDEIKESNILKKINLENTDISLLITIIKNINKEKKEIEKEIIKEKEKEQNIIINESQDISLKISKNPLIKKEDIENLIFHLNKSNQLFNKALDKNRGEIHNNYSPCMIINKYWIDNLIHIFINIENLNNNNFDIFKNYKLLIPSNISNNDDIYIITELFFINLFPFFDELEKNRDLFNDYVLYLNDNKGVIIIDHEIYIFETLENDVNKRINFIKIKNQNLILEKIEKKNFELDDITWEKLKSNILYEEVNNSIIINQNYINQDLNNENSEEILFKLLEKEKELNLKHQQLDLFEQDLNNPNINNNINSDNNNNYNNFPNINTNTNIINNNSHNINNNNSNDNTNNYFDNNNINNNFDNNINFNNNIINNHFVDNDLNNNFNNNYINNNADNNYINENNNNIINNNADNNYINEINNNIINNNADNNFINENNNNIINNNYDINLNINNINYDNNSFYPDNNNIINNNNNYNINNNNNNFNFDSNFNNNYNNDNNIINTNSNISNNNMNDFSNNNNINNDQQRVILDKFLPTIGLANLGATCYINATLQCLAHCIELSEDILTWYLFYPDKNKESRTISYSYAVLLDNIYNPQNNNNNQNYYSPNDFREIIAFFGPLFEENKANDSKDIFQFLIEKMHEELNVLYDNNINYDENAVVNQFDEIAVFNNFELMCQKKYHSYITKYLYGKQKTITKCLNCQCSIFNFQVYSFLIFPLLDVKKFKLSTFQNNYQNLNQILTLYDCFNYFQKLEFFSGENRIYCMGCKLETNANYCNLIYSTPIILTIILNRGKNNADFNERFLFPTELNLENYTQDKTSNNKFYLIGVLCHVGESSMNGHFFAYCRSHYQSHWFKYNDAIISECDETEIFMATTPYLLFYHKYL